MRALAPLAIAVLVAAAAAAVFLGGEVGAAAVAVGGGAALVAALVFLQGDATPLRPRSGRRAEAAARFLTTLVIAGFLGRAALAASLDGFDLDMALGGDAGTFDSNGRVFAAWLDGRLPRPFQAKWEGTSQTGYFAFVGTCFHVFGPTRSVPILVNCLLGALTAVPVYRLAARLGGDLAGRISAVLVTVFPSLVLWSCLMVRDAIVFFLIAWAAALGQGLLRRLEARKIATLVVALALIATLRTYMFLLLGGALVVAFAVSIVRRPGRATVIAVLGATAVIALVRGAGLGDEFLGVDVLERIDEQRRLNALAGNTAIDIGAHDLTTPGGALTYLPVGLTYFLLAPFPWDMGGRQILALPDVLVWYACLPFLVVGVLHAFRRRRADALVPLVAGASIAVLYGLVEGNVGIIVRHRAQSVVLLLPFIGVAAARFVRSRARRVAEDRERRQRRLLPRVAALGSVA